MNQFMSVESEKPIYTFEDQVNQEGRLSFLHREKKTRFVLDTGRPDVTLLANTRKWDTEYRSPLPSEQEKTHWWEYYSVGEENTERRFIKIRRFTGSSQAEYGKHLNFSELMDVLETAELGHLTSTGREFLNTYNRRTGV